MQTSQVIGMAQQREAQLAQVAAGLRNEAQDFVRREISLRESQLRQERLD